MATDATGTPTSPDNIPTYNTAVDSPSGLGFNAAMALIQTALSGRVTSPVGIVSGEAAIWNGAAWARSSVTGLTPSGIAGYPSDGTKRLLGDGTWKVPPGAVLAVGFGQAVSTTGTTFATGQNVLASNLTLNADGVSRYVLCFNASYGQIAFAGTSSVVVAASLDGVAGNNIVIFSTASNVQININGFIDLGIPTAAAHTVNAKAYGGSGNIVTIPAGGPVFVMKVT